MGLFIIVQVPEWRATIRLFFVLHSHGFHYGWIGNVTLIGFRLRNPGMMVMICITEVQGPIISGVRPFQNLNRLPFK
jgi:hypothetical protein